MNEFWRSIDVFDITDETEWLLGRGLPQSEKMVLQQKLEPEAIGGDELLPIDEHRVVPLEFLLRSPPDFVCPFCQELFDDGSNLEVHIMNEHPDQLPEDDDG